MQEAKRKAKLEKYWDLTDIHWCNQEELKAHYFQKEKPTRKRIESFLEDRVNIKDVDIKETENSIFISFLDTTNNLTEIKTIKLVRKLVDLNNSFVKANKKESDKGGYPGIFILIDFHFYDTIIEELEQDIKKDISKAAKGYLRYKLKFLKSDREELNNIKYFKLAK